MEHLVKQQLCPVCGEFLDAAANVGPAGDPDPRVKPAPDSITVCAGCAEVLVFTSTMDLEIFTDWDDIPAEEIELLLALQAGVRSFHAFHKRKKPAEVVAWPNTTRC
jgi:hypothetical protein